jgi:hypothetical protein
MNYNKTETMAEEKIEKKDLKYLTYTLERYFTPIKMLTGEHYCHFPIIHNSAKTIVKLFEENLNKVDAMEYKDNCIYDVERAKNMLSFLYKFDNDKSKTKTMVYVAYLVFNDSIVHILHVVLFESNWFPITKEYICDIETWKDLVLVLYKMQTLYDGSIRVDFVIDYFTNLDNIQMPKKNKHKEFFDQTKCYDIDIDINRIYEFIRLENPAKLVEEWIKTVDVEPNGAAFQAAKEEFEGLAGVKKTDQE